MSGALRPLRTELETIEDHGVRFAVRVLESLERKAVARREQRATGQNPFLPYDVEMLACELSSTHVALLNKYNVFDHHLLIVTRAFEPQKSWLNRGDFEALAVCLGGMEGLGFYNAGVIAGASQEHKHLQLVPLPLGAASEPIPIESVLSRALEMGTAVQVPGLDFEHAFLRLPGVAREAAALGPQLHAAYSELLAALGIDDVRTPYNLLVTRRWMLAVPRAREHFETISVNALGFAGSLLVRSRAELDLVKERGPMSVLAAVAGRV